ncbi:glycoside hydrolase family 3 protein [Bifidobacterium eulemuris]|uniref:Glycoside hydrolase family 3 C-terminal domain-containing protein n=1 Tax=Bifidobacterium eulemuris TaxID=1765219 RepID=A0A261GDH3_9BIFI|nr:glycoside hydrolase family 3 protein [Bifidobacterium eulemuris]OZG69491.1 Glycosyl hydrolase family 3 N terminal domain-containing protein [Bifidobacterium eulemuris]QOL32151.1 glycoside hydrolase family 3 C-terminal domain-containing protein [Bifidobacterium eulemuris]
MIAASPEMFINYCIALVIVLAIVIVASAIALTIHMRRKKQVGVVVAKHVVAGNALLGTVAVVVVGATVALNLLTSTYSANIDSVFTKTDQGSVEVATDKDDWYDLIDRIGGEGMTLMRNDNGALPLQSQQVNLLGSAAYNPVYSGSGSGSVSAGDSISIIGSLNSAGIETNSAPVDEAVYSVSEPTGEDLGYQAVSLSNDEVPVDSFTGTASFEAMREYSDTAIMVLGRSGGEGDDLTMYGTVDGADYLQLSPNERDILQRASETFDTLIVVVNSANALEMGFLDEYGVDACVWAGLPGPYGFSALGKILTGEVNPSGKLPDTWLYDNYSNPVSENFGEQEASNREGSHYVDYVEGIYLGYKWFETAYAEEAVITNTKTQRTYDYGRDYDSIVAFPFGYGLSYTTFEQHIVGGLQDGSAIESDGTVSVDVEVTNTGAVAGKEVVQLYVTAPYTDYDRQHGVEKAAVSLVGYAKTDELQPGESQTLTVEVSVEDLASYDSTYENADGTTGAYMLDAGEYVFSVRANAHESYGQVSGHMQEQYFFSGDNKRSTDDQQAYNQFDDAARGIYLSRQNGFANYADAMNSVSSELKSTAFEDDPNAYDESYDTMVTQTMQEGVDYAVDGDLTLADMADVDYDDEQWQELISQLTLDELQALVEDSAYSSPEIKSIDKPETTDADGPLGIAWMFGSDLKGVAYPSIPLLAATFNTELAQEFGAQMSDQCHSLGLTGWNAPAMNMHRWAFSGRNYEYYSEDSYLSGRMAADVVEVTRENGLNTYIKHFALNDQETERSGRLHTYSNEQAIREIYLKPFEMAVKDGGTTALMNSMNFIGDDWVGTSEALMTEVLRDEWGFRGKTVTDMPEDELVRGSADAALRAGTDAWLLIGGGVDVRCETDADIYYLQQAAHHILYMDSRAQLIGSRTLDWHRYVIITSVELVMIAVLCIAALILCNRKLKTVVKEVPAAE